MAEAGEKSEPTVNLGNLSPAPGSVRPRKRVGRGIGSGLGKTAGRGHKGRLSRSGGNTPPRYEGGQMPLNRRVPKRGFRRLKKKDAARRKVAEINLGTLARFGEGAEITPEVLVAAGVLGRRDRVKILGDGEPVARMSVAAHAFSKSARKKIVQAGGSVRVIAGP